MASSITLVQRIDAPDGSITFKFSDKSGIGFQSEADLISYQANAESNVVSIDDLKRYLICWSGRNGRKVNKTATYDITNNAGNIVRIQ